MKKFLATILGLALLLSLCACGEAACGDTHSWGDWTILEKGTNYTPAITEHTCSKCGEKESMESFDQMFRYYAELLKWIPFFTEAERLQQNLDSVITAAFFGEIPVVTEVDENNACTHTIKVSDLDDFTTKVFGCTYDYTGVENLWVLFESKASYDAAEDAIVIRAFGAGDETAQLQDVTYEVTDGGSYMVIATFSREGETFEKAFCVAKRNGNYVISTY